MFDRKALVLVTSTITQKHIEIGWWQQAGPCLWWLMLCQGWGMLGWILLGLLSPLLIE